MNIAEILKDAPKGTKLYSPLFGEVEFQSVSDLMIEVKAGGTPSIFYRDGRYYKSYPNLDEDGNIVSYCHWEYVVPINKFNFEDPQSNILNALK